MCRNQVFLRFWQITQDLNKIKKSWTPFCGHWWVGNVCKILARIIKLRGSYFELINVFNFSDNICMNFFMEFWIGWLVLPNYDKNRTISVPFQINDTSHLQKVFSLFFSAMLPHILPGTHLHIHTYFAPRHSNTGLVSSGASLTSWGEGASLALFGHPSSDGVTIKMPYGVDVLHQSASHPIFSYWVG